MMVETTLINGTERTTPAGQVVGHEWKFLAIQSFSVGLRYFF